MSDQLKSKLKELESKKKELQPKIDDINVKREEEIQQVNNLNQQLTKQTHYHLLRLFLPILIILHGVS